MKYKFFLILIFVIITIKSFSQNYYKEYPISIGITSNGSQNRIECSVYDSVLQASVTFNTNWISKYILISGNLPGKIAYTLWNSPGNQFSRCGFIIYDPFSHEFISREINFSLTNNQTLNVICGPVWFEVIKQQPDNNDYFNFRTYYRYNNLLKKWITYNGELYDWSTVDVWSLSGIGNTDRLLDSDDNHIIYYDPVSDDWQDRTENSVGNINTYKEWEDCFIGESPNIDYVEFYNYDPALHQLANHPRKNIMGDEVRGIFFGADADSSFKKFFFLYDLSIQQWVTDSVYSSFLGNIKIKDRVVAYTDSISGQSKKVFCMVYNPVSHTWVKDSTTATGAVTNLQIQNGTVKWNDANGPHIKGYDAGIGWGNFNTVLLLNFHLTDFILQGYNMIHVRNYSIGADSIYFDFGDGVVSSNKRHVLWHTYSSPGIYDICVHDSTGNLSSCQQVNMNLCSMAGTLGISNDTICSGDSTTLSIASFNGTLQWQSFNGTNWIDETGPGATTPDYVVYPTQNTKFRVKSTNGICLPNYSTEQLVTVLQPFTNCFLSDTLITKCANVSAILDLVGGDIFTNYQWQYNIGAGWINSSYGNTQSISANHTVNALYRVIYSKGNCYVDTSTVVTVNVNPVPPIPQTVPGQTCGPGYVDLHATGTGTMLWYYTTYDTLLFAGNNFSPYVTATKSFKVAASDSNIVSSGYSNNSIGNTIENSNLKKGIRFYTTVPAFLENVTVYPAQQGYVYIRLYHSTSHRLIASEIKSVNADSNGVKMWIRTSLMSNTYYDLVVDSLSVPVKVNIDGMSYPINSPGSSIVITGYVDSVFHSNNDFYNMYNINVTEGCRSNLVNVTATYYPAIAGYIYHTTPLEFCQGSSVQLNGSPIGSYTYNWLKNGNAVGITSSSYTVSAPGNYQVIVSNTHCSDTSASKIVRIPCIPAHDPSEKFESENSTNVTPQYSIYYDAGSGNATINAFLTEDEKYIFTLIDHSGKEIATDQLNFNQGENQYSLPMQSIASGLYIVKLQSDKNRFIQRLMKY